MSDKREKLDQVIAAWSRVGAAFNVRPSRHSPDLERLLLDTAAVLAEEPNLLTLATSWLAQYPLFVARHRLATLVASHADFGHRAELGLLLDHVRGHTGTRHFDAVIALCKPLRPPRPLFTAQQRHEAWRRVAESESSSLGRRWGLWCQVVELKLDAIHPPAWIVERNPSFFDRAVLRGDLRLSILATLQADGNDGASELALAKAVGANRSAVRHALDALQQSCHVERIPDGRRSRIRLTARSHGRAA